MVDSPWTEFNNNPAFVGFYIHFAKQK